LYSLYQHARLMIYPSIEPRHLHYSPLEAMIIGTPVIYKDGGLLERLAGSALPGQCSTAEEMNEKAKRILGGDQDLINAIRSSQKVILEKLSNRSVHQQWVDALEKIATNEFTVAAPDLVGVEE
jgi:glycosyltransferase involved in cell wall biosynthesis